jgi:hypothetical protein
MDIYDMSFLRIWTNPVCHDHLPRQNGGFLVCDALYEVWEFCDGQHHFFLPDQENADFPTLKKKLLQGRTTIKRNCPELINIARTSPFSPKREKLDHTELSPNATIGHLLFLTATRDTTTPSFPMHHHHDKDNTVFYVSLMQRKAGMSQ